MLEERPAVEAHAEPAYDDHDAGHHAPDASLIGVHMHQLSVNQGQVEGDGQQPASPAGAVGDILDRPGQVAQAYRQHASHQRQGQHTQPPTLPATGLQQLAPGMAQAQGEQGNPHPHRCGDVGPLPGCAGHLAGLAGLLGDRGRGNGPTGLGTFARGLAGLAVAGAVEARDAVDQSSHRKSSPVFAIQAGDRHLTYPPSIIYTERLGRSNTVCSIFDCDAVIIAAERNADQLTLVPHGLCSVVGNPIHNDPALIGHLAGLAGGNTVLVAAAAPVDQQLGTVFQLHRIRLPCVTGDTFFPLPINTVSFEASYNRADFLVYRFHTPYPPLVPIPLQSSIRVGWGDLTRDQELWVRQ